VPSSARFCPCQYACGHSTLLETCVARSLQVQACSNRNFEIAACPLPQRDEKVIAERDELKMAKADKAQAEAVETGPEAQTGSTLRESTQVDKAIVRCSTLTSAVVLGLVAMVAGAAQVPAGEWCSRACL
jgi:hypothetical protein